MAGNVSYSPEEKRCMIVNVITVLIDQRNMGMSMKVERSTVDQIKQRFEFNKKKKEEEKKKYGAAIMQIGSCNDTEPYGRF